MCSSFLIGTVARRRPSAYSHLETGDSSDLRFGVETSLVRCLSPVPIADGQVDKNGG